MFIKFSELSTITEVLVALICGVLISICLRYCNQRWSATFQSFITFALLPVITYVITNVISDNIALSLGMVGALSIVRFRHPVRNALELVMYFDLIAIGISSGVNLKYTILLTTLTLLIITITYIYFYKINQKNRIISPGYNEGENGFYIELDSISNIKNILEKNNLIELNFDKKNNLYTYRLFFSISAEAKEFYTEISKNENILNIKLMNE